VFRADLEIHRQLLPERGDKVSAESCRGVVGETDLARARNGSDCGRDGRHRQQRVA
jgi:hypothetical protein